MNFRPRISEQCRHRLAEIDQGIIIKRLKPAPKLVQEEYAAGENLDNLDWTTDVVFFGCLFVSLFVYFVSIYRVNHMYMYIPPMFLDRFSSILHACVYMNYLTSIKLFILLYQTINFICFFLFDYTIKLHV